MLRSRSGRTLSSIPTQTTNILADRLKKLVENKIVDKQRDPKKRTKIVYRLTKKGKDLLPVMLAIVDWAEKHDPNSDVPRDFVRKLRCDQDVLEREILRALP